MKIRVIEVDGKRLPKMYYDAGNTKQAEFGGLRLGHEYLVYGMCVEQGCLSYLINTGNEGELVNPSWNPAPLFIVTDHSIPECWVFNYFAINEEYGVAGVWGYKELALSEKHFDGLVDREAEDIILFLKNMKDCYPNDESVDSSGVSSHRGLTSHRVSDPVL